MFDLEIDDAVMPSEISAQEAGLARLKLRSFPAAERETLRRARPLLRREFDLELAETIARTGEEGIVVSLRRYVRSVRVSGFLAGALFGFVVGAIATFAAGIYLAKAVDLKIANRASNVGAFYRFDDPRERERETLSNEPARATPEREK